MILLSSNRCHMNSLELIRERVGQTHKGRVHVQLIYN